MGAALTIGLLVLLTRLGLLTVLVLLLGLARLALRVLLPGLLALGVIGLLLRAFDCRGSRRMVVCFPFGRWPRDRRGVGETMRFRRLLLCRKCDMRNPGKRLTLLWERGGPAGICVGVGPPS